MLPGVNSPRELEGQVALVTGAGRGIGRLIARELTDAGMRVAVAARSADQVEQTAREIGGLAVTADVSKQEDVEAMAETVERELGPIDLLVNNAGVGVWGKLPWEEDPADWWHVFEINVLGAYLCARAVLPGMVERRAGRIVTIASELGLVGMAENAAYCASKGGVIALTKALAREYAAAGVLVNCVAPGPVVTAMLTAAPEYTDGSGLAGLPIGRYGEPDEIARVVEALAGDAGSFFVGQVVSPNGGAVI